MNEQSWTNLSSVLWVEQPVGTGFSQGTPNIQNEDDLAAQLVGFMQQFLDVFSELKGKKLYLTGESVSIPLSILYVCPHCIQYAGTYVPCKWGSTLSNLTEERPKILQTISTRTLLCWTSHCKGYGSAIVSSFQLHRVLSSVHWQGIASLSWDVVQEEIPAVDFVNKYAGLFSFKSVGLI